jgi:type IV pilus assembly protein PilE
MRYKGFTLIELLIAVAVIAILAAIAVPTYQNHMLKSRRTDAHAALSSLQLEMEKFRGSCTSYPDTVSNADDCAGGTIDFSSTSNDGHYTISITAATANSYTLSADPTGVQADDTGCDPMTITVNNSNPRGDKGPADCW